MMLRHLSRDLARRLPEWDASSRLAFTIAVVLLIFLLALGFAGPPEIQLPARIGAFGLLVSIQLLFLWANRRDVSPYHQAQQHFIAGEYNQARTILEGIPEDSRVSVDALVLLGNTYRHLRSFEKCQRALTRALELKSQHHLALFSIGKLHLICGKYALAGDYFLRAIEAGAPEIVKFELGQACYIQGEHERAMRHLSEARASLADDAPQLLMLQYYLFRLGQGEFPTRELVDATIGHWQDEAKRYEGTPYCAQLNADLEQLAKRLSDA